MLQMVRKEREELEQRLILEEGEVRALRDGDRTKQGKHRVYVDNEEEQRNFDADTWFGRGEDMPDQAQADDLAFEGYEDEEEDEEEVAIRPKTLSKKQIEAQEVARREKRAFNKARDQAQSRTQYKLQVVKNRERELVAAEEELEAQRAKMNNTVGGVNKHGVKFKVRERKR
jgi:U3 small nucleolar RNA-associated protein 11